MSMKSATDEDVKAVGDALGKLYAYPLVGVVRIMPSLQRRNMEKLEKALKIIRITLGY